MKLFQMLLARVDDERVDLDHHNFLDARVPQDFTQYETVAAAFDQDTLRCRVEQERRQRDGFVVDELVNFEELDDGVEEELPEPLLDDAVGLSLNFPVKSPYGSPRSVKLLIPPTCLAGEARCEAPRLS